MKILNSIKKCLTINDKMPKGGLYSSDKKLKDSESNVPWRISPEPFHLSSSQLEFLENLGTDLRKFYRTSNLLYSQSTRQIQPPWIADYLDRGKSENVIELGKMRRFRTQIPNVIRPDLLLTENGMVASELDSIPGGIGMTASLSEQYWQLGYDVVGGMDGMVDQFAKMLRSLAKTADPTVAIVISDESDDYRNEMSWLATQLRDQMGLSVHAIHPRELFFSDGDLFIETNGKKIKLELLYRFFELFDLKNITKSELMLYSAKKRKITITPPPKAYLEEKMLFALFHHPTLRSFWLRELGEKTYELLQNLIPKTWIVDRRELPPHAVIPELNIENSPITDFRQLSSITQKQRQFVLKPSGFSPLAWGGRGVSIGHDMSTEDWTKALENALESFDQTPYLLQEFHKSERVNMCYYDFHSGSIKKMVGRSLLRPYYFLKGEEVSLAGVQAIICPDDKKILHGMADSIIVPCASRPDK